MVDKKLHLLSKLTEENEQLKKENEQLKKENKKLQRERNFCKAEYLEVYKKLCRLSGRLNEQNRNI